MKGDFAMANGIFITGTGTDIGKTYVTALLAKSLVEKGINAGYYKAAISGAESIEESDAGYVKRISGINQETNTLLSYLYKNPLSPHLSARIEGNPVELEKVKNDFQAVTNTHEYVFVEGSGGIVCPIRLDEKSFIMLEDIVKALNLSTLVVADAGLGTINAVVLTVSYLREKNIGVKGIILNNYDDSQLMHRDNLFMIEKLTGVKVIGTVSKNADHIDYICDPLKLFLGDEEK